MKKLSVLLLSTSSISSIRRIRVGSGRLTGSDFLPALNAHGVTIDAEGFGYARSCKRTIDCNAVYKLLEEGLWWSLLAGKRLAVVSGNADILSARLCDESFVRANSGSGETWPVSTKVQCPERFVSKHRHWQRLQDEPFTVDWDLLLCSAGSLSAILCEHARQGNAAPSTSVPLPFSLRRTHAVSVAAMEV